MHESLNCTASCTCRSSSTVLLAVYAGVPQVLLAAVYTGVASLLMFLSNMYINYYLDKHHSAKLSLAERNNPSKKAFNLKGLLISVLMVFTTLLVLIFFQHKEHKFPAGALILSLLATLINFYFAQKSQIVEYFAIYLKKNFKVCRVSLFSVSLRVGPQPYAIEP